MAEEIARIRGIRNVYYRRMKTMEDDLNNILENYDPGSEETVLKLKALKHSYESRMAEVRKLDDEIIKQYTDSKDIEHELEEVFIRCDLEDAVLIKMDYYLRKPTVSKKEPIVKSEHSEKYQDSEVSKTSTYFVKLPKMGLPSFDGKIENWRSFWDRFEMSIDKSDELSDVDKFNYLLGLLTGEAMSCVSGLTLTASNYEAAKKILKDRFGNTQVVINAHMESLVKLPVIKDLRDITEVRRMYDKIESCVRNLKSLDISPDSYGQLLIPLLNEKIPDELKIIISRKFGDQVWKLEDMINYVKIELQAREICTKSDTAISYEDGRRKGDRKFTTASFLTETKGLCVYCRQSHAPSKCLKITDVKMRRNILRKGGRCYKCLNLGHIVSSCTSKYVCRKCNKDGHHISICDEKSKDGN